MFQLPLLSSKPWGTTSGTSVSLHPLVPVSIKHGDGKEEAESHGVQILIYAYLAVLMTQRGEPRYLFTDRHICKMGKPDCSQPCETHQADGFRS